MMRFLMSVLLLLGATQAAAQPYAYVPNAGSNDVSVIDAATNTVIATVPVGTQPWGVAVTPDSSRAYIANLVTNNVSVIDTGTNTVIATVAVGVQPYAVTVSPDGAEAWVMNAGSGSVSVIDTTTNTVVDTIAGFNFPIFSDFLPDGSRALIANRGTAEVLAVDTTTRTVVQTYAVGANPITVAVAPDGGKAYVAHDIGAAVSAIDLGTSTVGTVPGTTNTAAVAFLPDSSRAYATNYASGEVYAIDAATDTLAATILGMSSPLGAAVTPSGAFLYVADRNTNSVAVIDTLTNTIALTIPVGSQPYSIGEFFAPTGYVSPGVALDASPAAPRIYAQEIVASPGSPVTLVNNGSLNLSSPLGYSFSVGEVRYARFECDNGLRFGNDSVATYTGAGDALLGSINGLGGSAMYFSITANDNGVVGTDRLIIEGSRQITGTTDVNCTYSLYDFPSQAQAGGANGRVATVSGPYLRFVPSYALVVNSEGNPVADVESDDPSYSEFVLGAPTFDILLGQVGGFSYGTANQVNGVVQPRAPSGLPVTLADLMDADTALVFSGNFDSASDVFFSPNADCSVNVQSADGFDDVEAVFTIGSNAAMDHFLCFATNGVAIPASEYTVALDAVSADPALWNVTGRGPLDLGVITRNGTELQAPLAQVPANYLSRLVLTNTGSQDRPYEVAVFGEAGNVISTANLTGSVPAGGTKVVDLTSVLTGFTAAPRATLNVTISGPNGQIQGLYQIVNPDSGTISNHVMVRPGLN
ncbi:YncE family protein [Arenimonas malthae]|nr:YncE family protein [Arenimonas malthae]